MNLLVKSVTNQAGDTTLICSFVQQHGRTALLQPEQLIDDFRSWKSFVRNARMWKLRSGTSKFLLWAHLFLVFDSI